MLSSKGHCVRRRASMLLQSPKQVDFAHVSPCAQPVLHTLSLDSAPAFSPLASSYTSSPFLGETPAAKHTTCCLAGRRLRNWVLPASAVFSSLVPRAVPARPFQPRRALAATAEPGSRFFCRHSPRQPRLTLDRDLQARDGEVMPSA
jgi:hypothetical protein